MLLPDQHDSHVGRAMQGASTYSEAYLHLCAFGDSCNSLSVVCACASRQFPILACPFLHRTSISKTPSCSAYFREQLVYNGRVLTAPNVCRAFHRSAQFRPGCGCQPYRHSSFTGANACNSLHLAQCFQPRSRPEASKFYLRRPEYWHPCASRSHQRSQTSGFQS